MVRLLGRPAFDRHRAAAAAARGALPLLTWEPWEPGRGLEQPEYSLARIAAGEHDGYVASYARQVRDWGGLLALRFAHELNAPSYPWGVGVNGNTPAAAVAAWRHVREVFRSQGAEVVWVWSVNVSGPGTAPFAPLFPGDDSVDWLGLDGYYGGTVAPWDGWRDPEDLLGPDVEALQELSDRPLLLTEVGSAEAGGDKAAWVRRLFAFCRRPCGERCHMRPGNGPARTGVAAGSGRRQRGGGSVGVFCLDRSGSLVFGAPNALWSLLGDVLGALDARHADAARTRDGFVPSWLARAWADRLFGDLGDVVVVARPVAVRARALRPVGVYRSGAPAPAAWSRAGEHLSVYDTPLATPLLRFAQVCTVTPGYVVTTLRPPAPGDVPSPVAVRRLLARSGLTVSSPAVSPSSRTPSLPRSPRA